jgi:hypothetical protein
VVGVDEEEELNKGEIDGGIRKEEVGEVDGEAEVNKEETEDIAVKSLELTRVEFLSLSMLSDSISHIHTPGKDCGSG